MLLAQITDLHVEDEGGALDAAAAVEACVRHLNALEPRPDVVVATGDLVQSGTRREYGLLREILATLRIPWYAIPGNHDDRGALRAVFFDRTEFQGRPEWIQYVVEDWPVRIVALDSVVPGACHGALPPDRIAWLDDRLRGRPERPTVLLMHHPPFRTGMAGLDRMGLVEGREPLARCVARSGCVERILSGHVHRAIQVLWQGTIASTAPTPGLQFALDLRADAEGGYVREPPACQLHLWDDAEGLVSHISFIGDYGRPRPFRTEHPG